MVEGVQTPPIPTSSLPPGTVTEAGEFALCNVNGDYFAVSRWCRHRRGDLAKGTIDKDGCLVCPVHGARYDLRTGRATDGPRVPGGGLAKIMMNRRPLQRGTVEVRDGGVLVR